MRARQFMRARYDWRLSIDRFRAGEDVLHAIEATELGGIFGKRVLQLQCDIGLDTLCLVRRGATPGSAERHEESAPRPGHGG